MSERVNLKKNTIGSCRFMQLAIFCKYICVHDYDWSISPSLLKVEIHARFIVSYCVAFLTKLYKLALPVLHINSMPISNTDSIKYLRYIFSNNNNDDAEILRQKLSLLSYVEVFAQRFTVPIFRHNIKKLHFRSFVLHISTYILKY